MVAVKVTWASDNGNDNATTQRRDDANNANDDADGEGQRRTDDGTARRRQGAVLSASPDGWRGARLCQATTAQRRQADDGGR